MGEERNPNQIIRKDARNCFVESLNDAFDRGRIHLFFATYDATKREGERQTNKVNIYIPVEEFLELNRKLSCGELKHIVHDKKSRNDESDIFKTLGGTSAVKLAQFGSPRADGMSLSRIFRISIGRKAEVALTADSGPGETDEKGLIVPRFKGKGENHVAVGMTFDDLSELVLMTKVHYDAWLTAWYMRRPLQEQDSYQRDQYKSRQPNTRTSQQDSKQSAVPQPQSYIPEAYLTPAQTSGNRIPMF